MAVPRLSQISLFLLSLISAFSFIQPTCTTQLLTPRATVPGPPADPPQLPGDGSGVWGSESPCGPNDWKIEAILTAGVDAFVAEGRCEAARCMHHYLLNTGADLEVNLANMMEDMPAFRDAIHTLAESTAKSKVENFVGPWLTIDFVSPWTLWHAWDDKNNEPYSLDWYYALGDYSYAVSGVVTRDGNTAALMTLQWMVHVFDRYNWDNSGKQSNLGWGVTLSHADIGHLHKCGGAREYVVRGGSKVQVVNSYDSTQPLPPVDTSGAVWCGWQPAKKD